ncbi:MAG: hypothetical protein AAFW97_14500 [Pseudomonadota bacterium]
MRLFRFFWTVICDWFRPDDKWSLTAGIVFGAACLMFWYQGIALIVFQQQFDPSSFGIGIASIAATIGAQAARDWVRGRREPMRRREPDGEPREGAMG